MELGARAERSARRAAVVVAMALALAACQRPKPKTCASSNDVAICDTECAAGDVGACVQAGDLLAADGGADMEVLARYRRACDKGVASACARAALFAGTPDGGDGGDDARELRMRACTGGNLAACVASARDALAERDVDGARRAYLGACVNETLFDGGVDGCRADVDGAMDALASAHADCLARVPNGCRREGEMLRPFGVSAPFEEECTLRGLFAGDGGVDSCVTTMREIAYCEGKGLQLFVAKPQSPSRDRCEKEGLPLPVASPSRGEPDRPTIVGPVTIASITADMPRATVQAALDRALPKLVACADAGGPFLTFEPMRIAFGIDPFGEVPIAHFIGWPSGDTRIMACVLGVVRGLRFPPGPRNTTVDIAITPKNVPKTQLNLQ